MKFRTEINQNFPERSSKGPCYPETDQDHLLLFLSVRAPGFGAQLPEEDLGCSLCVHKHREGSAERGPAILSQGAKQQTGWVRESPALNPDVANPELIQSFYD